MNRKTTYLSAITIGIASLLSDASAQSASIVVPAEILACADELDVMQRLSCYDREVAAAQLASEAPPPSPQPAAATQLAKPEPTPSVAETPVPTIAETPAPSETEAAFGLNAPVKDIVAIVVEIRERPYGELVIRLDNGQIWEQKHVDRRFRLRTGETVTISKGAISGYRLSGSGNRSIQVRRRN